MSTYEFILSAFGDEIDQNIDIQMDVLGRNGVKFIETRGINGKNIADYTVGEMTEVYKKMQSRGFGISSLGSPIGKIGIDDDFEPHLDKFKNCLDIAAATNTKFIRMFSFYMPQNALDANRDKVLSRWQKFIDAANGYDVTLLHENEHGIYGESADRCVDLITTLNTPKLRACFDPANFVMDKHDTLDAFEKLKDLTVYCHIKDASLSEHRVVPAGEGDGNVKTILDALKNRGFKGFLSIEPHLVTSDIAVGGAELFERALNALKRIM